ncbi:MAG: YfaP family protein [Pseudomonadota bacterium]
MRMDRDVRWKSVAPALCLIVLGTTLVACGGGGGGGDGGATPTPPTPTGYTSGRPAESTTAVTTAADLSNAIGIEGAASVSGSIPAPNASGLSSRLNQASTLLARTAKVGKKLAATNPKPRIANSATNYAAIQGAWILDSASSPPTVYGGYSVDGDSVYAVAQAGGICNSSTSFMSTADFLSIIETLNSNSAVLTGGQTLTRDTTGVLSVCSNTGTGTGSYGGTITATGQVLFTDNSTFNYTFNSASTPTAVFVQIEGADEYFVVPFSALTSDGAGGYTITFYGPTAGDTQIITGTLTGQITIQVFYGQVALADLLNATFTGSDDAANWSAPAYVDCVTQAVTTGDLQFNLTWNTANDVDLHVFEPGGNEIYWANSTSASGGQLDVDDVDGYGPENIYWAAAVPPGAYSVFVENYDGDAAPGYTLTVTKQGVSTTYTGSLAATAGAQSVPITITVP